jgi:Na+/H+-dicarboxylate symporter
MAYVVPLFMLFIGSYIWALPSMLKSELRPWVTHGLHSLTIFGLEFSAQSPLEIFKIYMALAIVTGIGCTLWHILNLLWVKQRNPAFSIPRYFQDYFMRIYPLLWATSSEALAMPLNLYLIEKQCPEFNPVMRRFVVGLGSFINVNGTLFCVFVMTASVAILLGLPMSCSVLLSILPVVYLIGFGVPGIPGELLVFSTPIMHVLNIPASMEATFLLLFVSLQFGLPDSFRTGANSTDNAPAAMILHRAYLTRFQGPATANRVMCR